MRSAARALVAASLVAVSVSAVPTAASASEGSVPAEVRAYVKGGGLVDRLDDVYGENAAGEGIPFDDTTKPGPISRVFLFTDERLAGDLDGRPTRMVNQWAVPVSLGGDPLGVAIVWINLETDTAELAEFEPDADAAVALADVPDDAQLVHEPGSAAWFALADDTLTPLVAGSSGVTEPTPVDEVALTTPTPAPDAADAVDDSGGRVGLVIAAVAILAAVVVAALLLPGRRRRKASGEV